ncbi:hypothetical protein Tco_1362979 [Tanacetum coccineum]
MNEIRPRNNFFKSHSPNRRPFNRPTASKSNPLKVNGVNTAKGNAVKSDVNGNWENVVKPSARCKWRPINVLDNVSKDSASRILKRVDCIDAHGRSKILKDGGEGVCLAKVVVVGTGDGAVDGDGDGD